MMGDFAKPQVLPSCWSLVVLADKQALNNRCLTPRIEAVRSAAFVQ